jgi:hypothetical protein
MIEKNVSFAAERSCIPPLPEWCLICKVLPTDGEPVCELCLQSAGMILVANADLFGVAADLLSQGWVLKETVRSFISTVPHGDLPIELLHALATFEVALRKGTGS